MLAGLHALFPLPEQTAVTDQALVAAAPDARPAGGVARAAFPPGPVLVVARRAFCDTGSV